MSYTDIGKETGLSTSAAQQRVRRLEQRGVITGYRAEINPEALGMTLTAIIALRCADPATDDQIPARISQFPEVVTCYSVTGEQSHLLMALVETPAALETLLTKIRQAVGATTQTTLILSTPFKDRPLV